MQQRVNWKDVSQIDATSADGTVHKITYKQEFERHQFTDLTWSSEKPTGNDRHELSDGTEVFRMANGTFEVDGSGDVLTP